VDTLLELAKLGRTVICTIHQEYNPFYHFNFTLNFVLYFSTTPFWNIDLFDIFLISFLPPQQLNVSGTTWRGLNM